MKFKKFVKESIEDMHKRCENCNTLLNELGTCPKCDEGEEDYGDELEEALTNFEKLKRAYPELNFDETIEEAVKCEELSNMDKLIQKYPELAEETTIVEAVESNLDKLKRAYPELNFDEPLTEGAGADTAHVVKDAMTTLAKDDKNTWAKTVSDVVDVIPDDFADELFDKIKDKFSNVKLSDTQKDKVEDAAGVETDKDTVGAILDLIDTRDDVEKNPQFAKTLVSVILGIIAVIEPTPVLEVITAAVMALPAEAIAKVLSLLQLANPVVAGATLVKKLRDDKNESLKSVTKSVKEDLSDAVNEDPIESDYSNYDDEYEFDDVEEDRAHAALYGGDRTYCSCGKKLIRTEWGGYCPDCDDAANYDADI